MEETGSDEDRIHGNIWHGELVPARKEEDLVGS